jgi:hypothetical protein
MIGIDETKESQANILCKSCGLCCTGHLFGWAQLRPAELDSAEALGMNVFRSDPNQRRFSQPCPLWHGQCTIYFSPHYPYACRAYKCKLLKEMLGENISLPDALKFIEQAKEMINEMEPLLPASLENNFRERLVERIENSADIDLEFRQKADALLGFYGTYFGVTDLIDEAAL